MGSQYHVFGMQCVSCDLPQHHVHRRMEMINNIDGDGCCGDDDGFDIDDARDDDGGDESDGSGWRRFDATGVDESDGWLMEEGGLQCNSKCIQSF